MRIGVDIIMNKWDKMRRTSDFFAHLCTREKKKRNSVFPSLLSLLQPLIKLCKSKHNESKLHLTAIMQYGILTLQPGFCSTHHLAIVGDRQDLCVFHVLRKKRTKTLMLYCLGFPALLEWRSVLHTTTGWDGIQPYA